MNGYRANSDITSSTEMPFFIGDVTEYDTRRSTLKHLAHIRDTQDLKDGDLVELFGHIIRWDSIQCVSEPTCRRYGALSLHT